MANNQLNQRRKQRMRSKLKRVNSDRLRLSVHRTNTNIYVQLIDDSKSQTIASASTLEKDIRISLKNGSNVVAAAMIGKLIAERAVKLGVSSVVFDRSGYLYHGRVKALADAARENGLVF